MIVKEGLFNPYKLPYTMFMTPNMKLQVRFMKSSSHMEIGNSFEPKTITENFVQYMVLLLKYFLNISMG